MATPPLLRRMCTAEDTTALVNAIHSIGPKSSYRDPLIEVLGQKGDPDKVVPILIEQVKSARNDRRAGYSIRTALDGLCHSSHPLAVKFLIDQLNDLKAMPEVRHEAFVHLAGFGGDAGVAAVRAARAGKRRQTWQDRFESSIDKESKIDQKTDSKGRVWRLLRSGVLGNFGDLYIQQKKGTGWDSPLFLGVYTHDTWGQSAPKTFRGIPIAKLLKTEWIKIFPHDSGIRKDTDGDGLTDEVEARLGTDPTKSDTDGDGIPDSVDPCPNAAPRQLDDGEKIVAACVEAHFFAYDSVVPAIIDVEGMRPFELYGYSAPLLWRTSDFSGTLAGMYNAGVNMIGFAPDHELGEKTGAKVLFEISADGKTAKTLISRYSGGLNGEGVGCELRKFGNDWLVVEMKMRYVS